MTPFELAESLFDQAERETRAGQLAHRNRREAEAHQHHLRAAECRQQAHSLLDQLLQPSYRAAG